MGCSRSKGANTDRDAAPPIMDTSCTLNAKANHTATVIFLHGLGELGSLRLMEICLDYFDHVIEYILGNTQRPHPSFA